MNKSSFSFVIRTMTKFEIHFPEGKDQFKELHSARAFKDRWHPLNTGRLHFFEHTRPMTCPVRKICTAQEYAFKLHRDKKKLSSPTRPHYLMLFGSLKSTCFADAVC